MRVSLTILGTEVVALELHTPRHPTDDDTTDDDLPFGFAGGGTSLYTDIAADPPTIDATHHP